MRTNDATGICTVDFKTVKREHERLRDVAAERRAKLLQDDMYREKFKRRIDRFFRHMEELAPSIDNEAEYSWLSDVWSNWQLDCAIIKYADTTDKLAGGQAAQSPAANPENRGIRVPLQDQRPSLPHRPISKAKAGRGLCQPPP